MGNMMENKSGSEDAGSEMKARLRADLRAAMKDKRTLEAKVIRALIAALDNAEAPPGQPAQQHGFHDGSAEVARLLLNGTRVDEIVQAEIAEREHAAHEMERLQMPDHAEVLRAEALIIRRYAER